MRYKHYKTGGVYELLHIGLEEDNPSQDVVVYQDTETHQIWVRPADKFFGTLSIQSYQGSGFSTVRRFQPVIGR